MPPTVKLSIEAARLLRMAADRRGVAPSTLAEEILLDALRQAYADVDWSEYSQQEHVWDSCPACA